MSSARSWLLSAQGMPVPHRRGDLHPPGPGPRRDPQLRRRRVRRALPALPGRPPGDLQRRPTRRDHQGRPGSAHRPRAAGFDAGAGQSWPSTWSPRGWSPRGGRRLSATKDWACCWARRAGPFNGCRAPKTSTDPNDETKKNRVLELAAIADAPAAAIAASSSPRFFLVSSFGSVEVFGALHPLNGPALLAQQQAQSLVADTRRPPLGDHPLGDQVLGQLRPAPASKPAARGRWADPGLPVSTLE